MPLQAHSRVAEFRRGSARYVPVARIAAGGMAEVWRGQAHFADGHVLPVAIKRVLPVLASNTLYRRMLEDEARVGMLLRHPHIVRVYDAREVRGSFILIMELVEGPSLRDLLQRLREHGYALPPRVALHIARQLAQALSHAHEAIDEWGRDLEIIHRDVSPHNVLVGRDGNAKLMDFGLANASSNLAERDPGMIGGKLGYISPELVLAQQSTHLLDVFALGIVLWECLAGTRLFQGKDDGETVRKVARCEVPALATLRHDLPEELDQVLALALAKDPGERYQSARELLADLDYVAGLLPPGDAAAETAQLVRAVVGRSQARPSASHSGSQGITQTQSGMTRSPVTHSGTRVPSIAAAIVEELELLAQDDEPSRALTLPSHPRR